MGGGPGLMREKKNGAESWVGAQGRSPHQVGSGCLGPIFAVGVAAHKGAQCVVRHLLERLCAHPRADLGDRRCQAVSK